MKEQNQFILL